MANGNGDIDVSVPDSETMSGDRSKKFTVYKIQVQVGNNSWFLLRRYNEFHTLLERLKKQYSELAGIRLPGKKLFGNNFDPDFIRQRREGLNDFIQKLLMVPNILSNSDVRTFLNLDNPLSTNMVFEDAAMDSPDSHDSKTSLENKELDQELAGSLNLKAQPSDFEFLKTIGKGSFGVVVLARHKQENKYYAIKVLKKSVIVRRNEARHIMAERNVLLKNVKHPFLVGLHYSFKTANNLYFVLDFVNGGELFFHLQKERCFSEARTKFYAAEIGMALGYIHSMDIIYRDLKPENILLDSVGHIVLTDFGLCKEGIPPSTTTSTFCGTPEYLAPEVLRKERYDRTVDWWCLGAVTYEMLYGLPPFYNRDTQKMYENILEKPLTLRTNISPSARDLLSKLLCKDPSKRLGYAADFDEIKAHPYFRCLVWDDLYNKKIQPPYCPVVNGPIDLRHFDPEFTQQPVPASVAKSSGGPISASVNDPNDVFFGFTYAPPTEALE